jgi:hypothetical protein
VIEYNWNGRNHVISMKIRPVTVWPQEALTLVCETVASHDPVAAGLIVRLAP